MLISLVLVGMFQIELMFGWIFDCDIVVICEGVCIEDVVGDYVQFRCVGVDLLKGLCLFYNEKFLFFYVWFNYGYFYCFGCGEGGDVYVFIQKIEYVSFVEVVELFVDWIGYMISYIGVVISVQCDCGSCSRLLVVNVVVVVFYVQVLQFDEVVLVCQYLIECSFDVVVVCKFGCGFVLLGWDLLIKYLQCKGFEFEELEVVGLFWQGWYGLMDWFYCWLLWFICILVGEVVGFGVW